MADRSDDIIGYMAALVAVFAYGSYGVPIKATLSVQSVHPLVIQSYKTITMSLISVIMILHNNRTSVTPWSFTKWGLLSGLLWVVGASFGIYAIRTAGMAQAVGTWASVMIAVNFTWGILIFREPVASIGGALGAFCLLGMGLVGMSWYSAPTTALQRRPSLEAMDLTIVTSTSAAFTPHSAHSLRQLIPSKLADDENDDDSILHRGDEPMASTSTYKGVLDRQNTLDSTMNPPGCSPTIHMFGRVWTLRVAGIAAAVVNGVLSGSSMIPLHYAKRQGYAGSKYFMSYAMGALVANAVIWVVYYIWNVWRERHRMDGGSMLLRAYAKLPEWHVRQLWLAGFSAGVLLSIAMFGSILSVTYLGQGVGNSIVQAKIFVSGLWGIFYYKEITGEDTITKWFVSAAITVTAIVWLTYERLTAG